MALLAAAAAPCNARVHCICPRVQVQKEFREGRKEGGSQASGRAGMQKQITQPVMQRRAGESRKECHVPDVPRDILICCMQSSEPLESSPGPAAADT